MKKKNIVIIGFGRFGSLLAKILKPYGQIFFIDEKITSSENAKQIEFKDLGKADWIFLAVPISSIEKVLEKIKHFVREGALVMDVCSVKVYPCRMLKKYLPKNVEIMGTHPMFGPDSAKNGLKDLQIVMCPLRMNQKNYEDVLYVFNKLKLKVIEVSPEEHDKQGAMNLSLVHFLGRGLGRIGMKDQEIKTMGFQRLLAVNETVNNDTWQLFMDMQRFNPYAKKIRSNFIKALQDINKKIAK